jgi:hypothetical protein
VTVPANGSHVPPWLVLQSLLVPLDASAEEIDADYQNCVGRVKPPPTNTPANAYLAGEDFLRLRPNSRSSPV